MQMEERLHRVGGHQRRLLVFSVTMLAIKRQRIWYLTPSLTKKSGFMSWLWWVEVIQKLEHNLKDWFKSWWRKMIATKVILTFGGIHWWLTQRILFHHHWQHLLQKNFTPRRLNSLKYDLTIKFLFEHVLNLIPYILSCYFTSHGVWFLVASIIYFCGNGLCWYRLPRFVDGKRLPKVPRCSRTSTWTFVCIGQTNDTSYYTSIERSHWPIKQWRRGSGKKTAQHQAPSCKSLYLLSGITRQLQEQLFSIQTRHTK